MSIPASAQQLPQLSKYELLDELGHGGMATVYRARDLRLDREVAIKVIHKHLRESPEVRRRFAAEARVVAKLRHPSIVEVYDVSADDDPEKYLVVELSRGVTLRRILIQHGSLPPEAAAGIGLELSSALAHAHDAGVIHRDVKPENVLVEVAHDGEADVRVKLTDFGIAKILDAQGVTSTGQVLGSPAHMAPEQIEGGEVDGRADVFALGVLLYECMVGHLPFEGSNPAQVLRRVLEGTYAAADRDNPIVGGRWARLLARSLAKVPAERFASAGALSQAISEELSALSILDYRSELRGFFADPKRYQAEAASRLVPVLTNRGEQARRVGDIVGAASDLSRALAYAPQDPELPKLMSRLRRRTAWRGILYASGIVAAVSVVLGVGGYIAARTLQQQRMSAAGSQSVQVLAQPNSSQTALREPEQAVRDGAPAAGSGRTLPQDVRSGHPSGGAHVTEVGSVAHERPHRDAPPQFRDVTFHVNPQGARVSIDDGPLEDVSFGKVRRLSVGAHVFRAEVPGSSCCKPFSKTVEIKREEGRDEAMEIRLPLAFNDATFSVPDAPTGATLNCLWLRISGPADHVYRVPMTTLEMDVSCDLESPATPTHTTSVRLRAGVLTPIRWPGP
jgi:eukaryotic-like serine/threonine-protein kinase